MREKSRARFDGGKLITPEDIALITGMSTDAAIREHAYIRKQLGHCSEDLLLSQYCDSTGQDYQEIMNFLYPMHPRKLDWMESEEAEY